MDPMTTMPDPQLIYVDGAMLPLSHAATHASRVAERQSTKVFEGLPVYAGAGGYLFAFRVKEHLTRLRNSVRIMQIDCDYSDADYVQAILMSLRENRIQSDANVRLIVYIRSGDYEEPTGAASVACAADARASTPIDDQGAHAAVSTWLRMDDAIMPPRIRTGANYHSTQFGYLEARRNGYDEAIFLTCAGKISQGANSCFAMVRKGAVVAPPVTPLILDSVTRSTLLELAAAELGLPVEERQIDRSELYAADEAFFCSSSHEVRPVLSVDRLPIGDGCVGPITRRLWETYQAVVRGRSKTRAGWLTPLFKPGYA